MTWDYIAGYFDGEGSVLVCPARPSGKAFRCELSWANSHRESLEVMRTFMGCGRVSARKRKPPYKTMYALLVSDRNSMARVADELIDRCIIKRDRLVVLRQALEGISARSEFWGQLSIAGAEEITRLYQVEGWTQQRIGDHFGVGQSAVKMFMKRSGIAARSHSDAAHQAQRNSPAWFERNKKIGDARKREWSDPEVRARRVAAMQAGQAKRIASRQESRAERGGSW